jgi:uncharacterized protein
MKVTLEKTFPMPASADIAWTLLQQIEEVAACMPGARITERIDATHYKGTVAVKFGPASMAFRGDIEVAAVEVTTQTLRLIGTGTDNTGGSGASMDLTARIAAIDAAACNLVGTSEVSMSGKAAAFGGRMMGSVADQILKQFAVNFANKVQALQAAAPPAGAGAPAQGAVSAGAYPTAPSTGAAASAATRDDGSSAMAVGSGKAPVVALVAASSPSSEPGASADSAPSADPGAATASSASAAMGRSGAAGAPAAMSTAGTAPLLTGVLRGSAVSPSAAAPSASGGASGPAMQVPAAAPSPAVAPGAAASSASNAAAFHPAPASELNAFALIWAVFKDWLRSIFGARRA